MRNFSSGKSVLYVLVDAATHGFTVVLITELVSRQNTFVGRLCAPPSAFLVYCNTDLVNVFPVWPWKCRISPISFLARWCKRRPEPGFSFVKFCFAYAGSFHWFCLGLCVVTQLWLYLVFIVQVK